MTEDSLQFVDSTLTELPSAQAPLDTQESPELSQTSDGSKTLDEDASVLGAPEISPADLGLVISSDISKKALAVGDTFDYTVSVSWKANAPLPLVPMHSVNVKGLSQISLRQISSRQMFEEKILSKNEFVYTLVANDTGALQIPALSFEIPVQNAVPITVKSEEFPLQVNAPFSFLPLISGSICALAVIFAFIFRHKKKAKESLQKKSRQRELQSILDEMLLLKARIPHASAREWLLALEDALKHFARWKFGDDQLSLLFPIEHSATENENILRLFENAHYGGGSVNELERREIWKRALEKASELEELLKEQ